MEGRRPCYYVKVYTDSAITPRRNLRQKTSLQGPAFIYSGNVWGSLVRNLGENGNWWSSTVATSAYGYNLNLNMRGNMNPQNQNNKSDARAVRCVAGS